LPECHNKAARIERKGLIMGAPALERAVAEIIRRIAGRPVEPALVADLAIWFPPERKTFRELAQLCRQGIAEGWLCMRERDGVRFSRPVPPGPATGGFSVDVALMEPMVGPYHLHPAGEIIMVIPDEPGGRFDGHGEGWLVYGPGSAHYPTVNDGRTILLYLLPGGAIDFTARPPAGVA
jgi:hypothetical protein